MSKKSIDAPHRDVFLENEKEVKRLLDIHSQITESGPGHKPDVEVLNKSALILLVATWESYVEELATNSFDFLIENCYGPDDIPKNILAMSSRKLCESQNHLDVWKLAEKGWLDVVISHRDSVIKKYISSLNTPRTNNVDEVFYALLGVKNISKHWYWKGMSNAKAKEKLESLIKVRGEIAHTVRASKPVTKTKVKEYAVFLNRLATITHNRCVSQLVNVCGVQPWNTYNYGKTR